METTEDVARLLFAAPEPGSGLTQMMIVGTDTDSEDLSAALAVRESGLPFAPVNEEDEYQRTQRAMVEFLGTAPDRSQAKYDVNHPNVQKVDEIPARIVFLGPGTQPDPYRKPVSVQAQIFMGGDSEVEMNIRYVPGINMSREDLSGLLYDAYVECTIPGDFGDWDAIKYERDQFRSRMEELAESMLGNPGEAFRMALERHMRKFQAYNIPEPEETTRVSIPYGDGRMNAAYRPDRPSRVETQEPPEPTHLPDEGKTAKPQESQPAGYPSRETIQERRSRWAHTPDALTQYHTGAAAKVLLTGETIPRHSFFGQGLLVVMEEISMVSWSEPNQGEGMTWWSVYDTTETLWEFYDIAVETLDEIHERQQSPEHRREDLAQMVMNAPHDR